MAELISMYKCSILKDKKRAELVELLCDFQPGVEN